MFTGIIQEIGTVGQRKNVGGGVQLTVKSTAVGSELSIDDSVSINGCCQTVISKSGSDFTVEAVEETLKKTTLGEFNAGRKVNLELAMRLNDRLGGHLVLGHVDGTATVSALEEMESSWLYTIQLPSEFMRYVIHVGSIAIDGVSLTIARLNEDNLTVSIVPHTFENTTFKHLKPGMRVNFECDLVGKYIERLMSHNSSQSRISSITSDKLTAWGYKI
jgi:riboflavin synthase